MNLWFKKTTVPLSNETKVIDTVQLWQVDWKSWKGEYPFMRVTPEIEVFTSEEEANSFAESLRQAFKLVRQTDHDEVTITKRK